MNEFFGIIERTKNKWLRFYRKKVFEWYTGQKTQGLSILGNITLINHNIKIGKNVFIYPGVMLWGDGEIAIGDNVNIGNNTVIYSSKSGGGVTIGDNTMIAAQCYIIDMDHGTASGKLIREQENSIEKVTIGNDAWLGANVTILKGSNIGDGAVIGAKALVKGEIPSGTIACGMPAKTVKKR